jgi:hypothetical protein
VWTAPQGRGERLLHSDTQHVEQCELLGQPGSIDLYLPYYDVSINQENVTEISHWPDYRGSAQATLSNNLGGGELNLTWSMPTQDAGRVDLLGGFRFLQLRESYTITTSSPYNPPNPADIWNTTDAFDARNRFYRLADRRACNVRPGSLGR